MKRIFSTMAVVLCTAVSLPAAAEEAKPADAWATTFNLGLNLARGNSESLMGNAALKAEKKAGPHELTLGVDGNYGEAQVKVNNETNTQTTVENVKGYANYKYLLTERDYAYLNGEVLYDSIADIDYRVTLGPGLGRHLVKNDRNLLDGEAGIAYITDKVGGVEDDRFALRVAEKYEFKVSGTAKLWESVEYLPAVDDFNNYLLNAEIGAEAAMNTRLSLRVVAQDKYNSRPAAGKEHNDVTLTAGIAYKI